MVVLEETKSMDGKHRTVRGQALRAVAFLAILSLVSVACGTAASPAPTTASQAAVASAAPSVVTITPPPLPDTGPGPNGGTIVRWFIGLGTGGQPQQVAAEQKVAADFNAAQTEIFLSVEIYDNTVAGNILKTQIAAGNPPDIIGPVGVEGLNLFRDQLLDLTSLVASEGYDTSKVDPALNDFWKMGEDNALIGLPFATYPSFLFYNKDLFDEAGLPYPPTKVGDQYQGKPWDMNTLREVAMKLTVDATGNDATSADFDPDNVVQWGFDMQWADNSPLAEASLFGASSFVADDGVTAQIPDEIATGEKWFNDGVWQDHFIPNANQINSDLLDKGNLFESGNLAMNETHSWYTCCVNPAPPASPKVKNFGFAIAPAHEGEITAKLHADTFSLLKTTKHPELAFQAMAVLLDSAELLTNYGAFPADPAKQEAFFASVDASYPGVTLDWSVPQAMLAYPDIPNHQAFVPNYAKAKAAWQAFQNKYRTSTGVDIDAELETLKTTLQGIFDEVAP
jgi:multiple sugar transport system substrate-binding protein